MIEAVAVFDQEFRFVSVNPAFTRITGYTDAEVIGPQPAPVLKPHWDSKSRSARSVGSIPTRGTND